MHSIINTFYENILILYIIIIKKNHLDIISFAELDSRVLYFIG